MKKKLIWVGIVVLMLLIIRSYQNTYHNEVQETASVTLQSSSMNIETPVSVVPTELVVSEEERRNIQKDFFSVLVELEHYPIAELRTRFTEFVLAGTSGKVQFNMDPARENALGTLSRCNGVPMISISLKYWLKKRNTLDKEAAKDSLLLTILHEFYHYKHDKGDGSVTQDRQVFIQDELNAWSDELHSIDIMIQKGRQKSVLADSSHRYAWEGYKHCNKDPKSYCWFTAITNLYNGVSPVSCQPH